MQGNDLLSSPAIPGSAELVILHKYTSMEFTLIKSRAMTLSRSQQCRTFSRAVMDEKSLSPLFPVGVCVCAAGVCVGGGGAVVTSDWCNSLMNVLSVRSLLSDPGKNIDE